MYDEKKLNFLFESRLEKTAKNYPNELPKRILIVKDENSLELFLNNFPTYECKVDTTFRIVSISY